MQRPPGTFMARPKARRDGRLAVAGRLGWCRAGAGRREWRFEVVDGLTPALMEGGGSGWLAYGTLAWEGHPQQASTTDAGSGS